MIEIEKGINLIQGKSKSNSKEIAWNLFIRQHNQVSMFAQTKPQEYQENIKEYKNQKNKRKKEKKKISYNPKRLNTNAINSCFKIWRGCNFFNEFSKLSAKDRYPRKYYQLNLTPLFEYFRLKNIDLSPQEKNILMFLFNPEPVRNKLYREFKENDFLTAIPKFYIKYFHIPFLRREFTKLSEKFKFNREFLDTIIIPKYKDVKEIKDVNINQLLPVNTKLNEQEIIWENNLEKFNLYLGNNSLFRKIKNKWYMVEYDRDMYISYYSSLHEYFKEIIEKLDVKMGRILGIY